MRSSASVEISILKNNIGMNAFNSAAMFLAAPPHWHGMVSTEIFGISKNRLSIDSAYPPLLTNGVWGFLAGRLLESKLRELPVRAFRAAHF